MALFAERMAKMAGAANGHANGTTPSVNLESMEAYAAPSLFQPHRVRQAIRDAHEGKRAPLFGYYAGLSSIPVTRWLAPLGFDTVWFDWEHTSCNVETMTTMVHEIMFMSGGRTAPFVRVPGHDHAAIGFALDAGASVVIPQVDTVEQAKHVVSAAKFGTRQRGTRSAPPFRYMPGVTDVPVDPSRPLHENLNDQAAIMIQIETLEGIRNLDAMLTEVPDIDIVWLGSLDARVSMNMPPSQKEEGEHEPEWLEALQIYNATMKKHNKPRGGGSFPPPMASVEDFQKGADKLSYCVVACDVLALMGMGESLKAARASINQKPRSQ